MNGKSLGMLCLAVLCGLAAMFAVNKLLSRNKEEQREEKQDVLVAARDLRVEEVIKPEVVKIVQLPRSSVPPGAFSVGKDAEGRWVQYAMLENEPILDRKLAVRGSPPGLIARIPKGMRAFAIEVNEQTGVSGFVLPDHRVDVVQVDSTEKSEAEAHPVLQDILVLASGQTFTRPEDRSIQARTVTLAVTPEQVDILVAAKSKGTLSLSLRGLNDHTQAIQRKREGPRESEKSSSKKPELVSSKGADSPAAVIALTPAPTRPGRFVTIYRGLENVRRVRIDQVGEESTGGETVAAGPVPTAPQSAPVVEVR